MNFENKLDPNQPPHNKTAVQPETAQVVQLLPQHAVFFENQVVVTCFASQDVWVRVWPIHTYLNCNQTGHRSALLFCEKVAIAPDWTHKNQNDKWLLIFQGLPKQCHNFDLIEDIPLPGKFYVKAIQRNQPDVYAVWF